MNTQLVLEPGVTIAVLIAATLPFAVSILTSFSAATRVAGLKEYFVYNRDLDIDGFIKTSIGYSLQVASITLFFYWTITKGAFGPVVVCAAWGIGYFALAAALRRGKFSGFLGSGRNDASPGLETIHGFIGSRLTNSGPLSRRLAILSVAVASVLGLAGTMMVEIGYSADYLLKSLNTTDVGRVKLFTIQAAILTFTTFYVLWGGYRSAVATDRFQVPIAYVFFSIFTLAVAVWSMARNTTTGMGFVVLAFGIVILLLLVRRIRLLNHVDPRDTWSRLTAFFTFIPIIILVIVAVLFSLWSDAWSIETLFAILLPRQDVFLGFGAWGTIALVTVNAIWQFIDISSLQRLQSLDKDSVEANNASVGVRTLHVTGTEAALGWVLIILAAAVLKMAGFTAENFISRMLADDVLRYAVPIFVLTVFVYMLSTISGFISAISYISHYDIVPSFTGETAAAPEEGALALISARVTTLIALALLFLLYIILKLSVGDKIAAVLYAIYAFQIAILPSVMIALFWSRRKLRPSAVIVSVVGGIASALFVALKPLSWQYLSIFGVGATDWETMPPLISTAIACTCFGLTTLAARSASRVVRRPAS